MCPFIGRVPGVSLYCAELAIVYVAADPMPKDASGQGDVLVGRIRQDTSDPSGKSIAMFVAGDQLLKGAALNAVQIAEVVVERGLLAGTRR